jgi:hypothetical protein
MLAPAGAACLDGSPVTRRRSRSPTRDSANRARGSDCRGRAPAGLDAIASARGAEATPRTTPSRRASASASNDDGSSKSRRGTEIAAVFYTLLET